jgi:hypothetical protein
MAASIALSPALGLPQRTIITAMPDVSRHSNASDLFYASLPVFADFAGVAQPERYRELPDDWHVAVADVEGPADGQGGGHPAHPFLPASPLLRRKGVHAASG